jgi:aerobic-type carbon monoxide dehydrogenase small subunit (CoxS/CutS family)
MIRGFTFSAEMRKGGNMPNEKEEEKKTAEGNAKVGMGPISRREFTIGSVSILGATSLGEAKAANQAASKKTAPGAATPATVKPTVTASAQKIKLTVNKWEYEVHVEPHWTLRDVLRDQLGFTSVKDMCNGYGACGSCTVILNGRPVLSCLTLAAGCDAAKIETAEGVAVSRPDLIEAYIKNHCMQCGYCTPGFVVTAKALVDRIPNPREEDIREALGGNICRCGTYPAHIVAVKEIAKSA